jgi:hypothetical protein
VNTQVKHEDKRTKVWRRKSEDHKKDEEKCQLALYAQNRERSIIAKQKKEKYTKVWRRKSEDQKKEECEPTTHVDSGCLSHKTGTRSSISS